LAGESYAGQYIPYIAKHILQRNKQPTTPHTWNLSGLLIGNGWISPPEQYEAYLQFAYEKGILQKGTDVANRIEMQHGLCLKDLATAPFKVGHTSCEAVLSEMLEATSVQNSDGGRDCYNMYDVRLRDSYPSCGMSWPPDLEYVTPYLRRSDVVAALHINPNKNTGWTECSGAVGRALQAPESKASVTFLPQILSEVPVVLFSGAEDLICNHLGTEALIGNMEWNGGKGFEISPGTWAPRRDWTFEGEPAGFWQEARNLTYVLFYNSSHMVPFDYARRTRDMLDRFIGVDISSIGGSPTDSRLDGEKGPETTVGGAAGNGTAAQEAEKAKLDAAKWQAYRKSGEIALVVVAIAAAIWGYCVWRDRRKRIGYQGLSVAENDGGGRSRGRGLRHARSRRTGRDVEAGDFDERELDDLHVETPMAANHDHYSVGDASDEEVEENEKRNGKLRSE
jgi:carboxypeptidase D